MPNQVNVTRVRPATCEPTLQEPADPHDEAQRRSEHEPSDPADPLVRTTGNKHITGEITVCRIRSIADRGSDQSADKGEPDGCECKFPIRS